MGTTTIRVDMDTHARLLTLSRETGTSLIQTVRDATEALLRQRFGQQVAAEMAALRNHPEGWETYLAESEETHVTDGIDR